MSPSIREELKLRQAPPTLEQEAQLNVVRTGALLNDDFDRMLRPYRLSTAQYNVLRILRGAEPDALGRNEIRDRMLTRQPDMTRLLDRMEAAGLVARERGGADRRLVSTRLTEKGRRLLTELDPIVTREQKRRLSRLAPDELRTLIALLTRVRE
jgi:DNA-binding MarR family transcriptional regulator